jgi:hypothetical protein
MKDSRPAVVRFVARSELHLIETLDSRNVTAGMEVETLCGVRDLPVYAELAADLDHGQIQSICPACLDSWGGIPIGRLD